jgi:sRNA-binding carbon storage regulator CsrA
MTLFDIKLEPGGYYGGDRTIDRTFLIGNISIQANDEGRHVKININTPEEIQAAVNEMRQRVAAAF